MTDQPTCRDAVLEAMQLLERRHGRAVFTAEEIIHEVESRWTKWKRSTISTHVTANMVVGTASSPSRALLERVDRGRYRLVRPGADLPPPIPERLATSGAVETGHQFEARARQILTAAWGLDLQARDVGLPGGVSKRFDLVSPDHSWVGDAKRYTTLATPAAKWSTIAEYVWLLQKLPPTVRTFMIFGGDDHVPCRWLRRFGPLAAPVAFYFLDGDEVTTLSNA